MYKYPSFNFYSPKIEQLYSYCNVPRPLSRLSLLAEFTPPQESHLINLTCPSSLPHGSSSNESGASDFIQHAGGASVFILQVGHCSTGTRFHPAYGWRIGFHPVGRTLLHRHWFPSSV